jgi:mannose-6-phosphate isomerase-like protein (cupin superfamily)
MKLGIIFSLALAISVPALAQENDPSPHTAAELQQHAAALVDKAKASTTGQATDVLDDMPSARTLLVVRVKTGQAERHLLWSDQMVVLSGTLTLVTGGTMEAEKPNGTLQGESLGASLTGGKELILHPGDIVHIPHSVPHWVKLAPGTTASYLVFKEK